MDHLWKYVAQKQRYEIRKYHVQRLCLEKSDTKSLSVVWDVVCHYLNYSLRMEKMSQSARLKN